MNPESAWAERVTIGGVDVTRHLSGAGFKTSIVEPSSAWFEIDLELANAAVADLFAEVEWTFPATGFVAFTGHVVSALESSAGRIRVECQSLPDLATGLAPRSESFSLEPPELFQLIARSSGLRDDQLQIHGLDVLPTRDTVTYVPLTGLSVDESVDVEAGLRIISVEQAAPKLERFNPVPWASEHERATSFAAVSGRARSLWEHEEEALSRIDLMLAWMQCRATFGLPVLPDGSVNFFRRSSARTGMRRLRFVMSEGTGGRSWIHEVDIEGAMATHELAQGDRSWLLVSEALSETLRQAILRCDAPASSEI